MIKFERIREDEDGAWPLDAYFEYLDGVAHQLPEGLRDFAATYESYQLEGKKTLHDSRVLSFTISKERGAAGVSNRTCLDVVLLDQLWEGEIHIRYSGVSAYIALEPRLLDREGHDVLLHEFSLIAPGRFRHAVRFDGDGGYSVDFAEFSIAWAKQ